MRCIRTAVVVMALSIGQSISAQPGPPPPIELVPPAPEPNAIPLYPEGSTGFPTMGFPIVEAWRKAKRAVELHAYGKGGHGFGLGIPGTTTPLMLDQFVAWMDMEGFLKPRSDKR